MTSPGRLGGFLSPTGLSQAHAVIVLQPTHDLLSLPLHPLTGLVRLSEGVRMGLRLARPLLAPVLAKPLLRELLERLDPAGLFTHLFELHVAVREERINEMRRVVTEGLLHHLPSLLSGGSLHRLRVADRVVQITLQTPEVAGSNPVPATSWPKA